MRLFFALWPPPDVAAQLAGIARTVAQRFGGKPSRQETLHLTLAFLGDVPDDRLPVVMQTARRVCAAPFALNVDRLGHWPRKQLLWAGETAPNAVLATLGAALQLALSEAGFALPGRRTIFSPHITLVRDFPEARDGAAPATIAAIAWPCSSFALIRSQRSDAGSFYEIVAEFPFGASSAAQG
jgi:2'-5' RNA ligase